MHHSILLQVQPTETGVRFSLSHQKAEKWLAQIKMAIEQRQLDSGAAQKLSGRLSWATQSLFYRLGRAMIKPIFAQKTSRTGHVGDRLFAALRWWSCVIENGVCEELSWDDSQTPLCHMFVDAASNPARCAAVLVIDGEVFYTDVAPDDELMSQLAARRDNQIMALVCFMLHSHIRQLVLSYLAGDISYNDRPVDFHS